PFASHHNACAAGFRPSGGASAVSELLYVSKSIAASPLRSGWRQYTPASRQQAIEPGAQPIVAANSRQKPGVAGVDQGIRKLLGIEAAGIVRDTRELPRRLPAGMSQQEVSPA